MSELNINCTTFFPSTIRFILVDNNYNLEPEQYSSLSQLKLRVVSLIGDCYGELSDFGPSPVATLMDYIPEKSVISLLEDFNYAVICGDEQSYQESLREYHYSCKNEEEGNFENEQSR